MVEDGAMMFTEDELLMLSALQHLIFCPRQEIGVTPSLLEPFIACGFIDSGGGLNPFVSSIVNSVIELGMQENYLKFLRETYLNRLTVLSNALRKHIPHLTFTDPNGGYFIWSRLPEGTDSEALLEKARDHKVGFQPGINFSSAQGLRNYLRLCFAFYGESDLQEGVRRLARVIT